MDKNVVWQKNNVEYDDRCTLLKQNGIVLWFTGLSGSGKSTIAVELEKQLTANGKLCYLLDGDNLRHGLNSDLGFSNEDRNENIRRISEVASLFQDAGLITLVSVISPFHQARMDARKKIKDGCFVEIYVHSTVEECMKRDPKGLYKKNINLFTGISSDYEVPKNPDIYLDTTKFSVEECMNMVLDYLIEKDKKNEIK